MADRKGYESKSRGTVIDLGSQTKATASDVVNVSGCSEIGFYPTVASIGTSVNFRLESSLDNSTWTPTYAIGDSDDQVTSNGLYALIYPFCKSTVYVRFLWVSSVGGTPTISVKVKVG